MRPPLEVADIIRAAGKDFIEKHQPWLKSLHLRVLSAIERCRTAALGGHRDRCSRCGHIAAISYNSCRKRAFRENTLYLPGDLQFLADKKAFLSFLRVLHQHPWVIYAKPPFGGANHVLNYLARYTHRVAISNHRLVALSDGKVTFRWKDYAHGSQLKLMTVSVEEFLRRFLLHTLPRKFVRIRFFGYMANRRRAALLPICRELIGASSEFGKSDTAKIDDQPTWLCPRCSGPMVVIQRLTAEQITWESFRRMDVADTS